MPTEWKCLKGLGKPPEKWFPWKPSKIKVSRKLTPTEKLARAEKRMKKGKRVGRQKFLTLHRTYLKSNEWKQFRKRVIAEVGGVCQSCFKKAKTLHVHHLHYRTWGHESLEDVTVLCRKCHKEIHL